MTSYQPEISNPREPHEFEEVLSNKDLFLLVQRIHSFEFNFLQVSFHLIAAFHKYVNLTTVKCLEIDTCEQFERQLGSCIGVEASPECRLPQ